VWRRHEQPLAVRRAGRILFVAAALAPVLAVPGLAQDSVTQNIEETGQALRQTEDALDASRRAMAKLDAQVTEIKQEVLRVRRDLVDAASKAQNLEANVSALETHLEALEVERGEKQNALSQRRGELTHTIAALQRISRTPPDLLIFMPASIQDISHARLLLGAVAGQLNARADLLGGELRAMARIGEEITTHRNLIDSEAERLESQRSHLGVLLARKTQIYDRTEAQQSAAESLVADLAAEAGSLHELLDRLVNQEGRNDAQSRRAESEAWAVPREVAVVTEPVQTAPAESSTASPGPELTAEAPPALGAQESSASDEVVPLAVDPGAVAEEEGTGGSGSDQIVALVPVRLLASAARGAFTMPARGALVSRFDETTALGLTTKGIIIETRAIAQIVAPYDGRVAFAGPFREYGMLLIIDHGEGYHTLLAGMGRIDVLLDQRVLAGEPVGVMAAIDDDKPRLYVELRSGGQAINPLPWLAAETIKVSG